MPLTIAVAVVITVDTADIVAADVLAHVHARVPAPEAAEQGAVLRLAVRRTRATKFASREPKKLDCARFG